MPSDSYYLIKYRIGDNNVIMRLRAWGANVEVLFPSDLRDKMRSDLEKLWKRYLD
ncbi:MAG: TIGR03985 family CRISPR-associated protein [Cyanobacteria bacterium J055]|nr:MAG: TIGR03985 family CRISPR-associated protein [Cyanobacteria bacterium J055]